MIALEGLSKKFGKRAAVHPFNLEVPRGRVFGLLGHNGAGKSTTIGMLLGQVFPDTGRALINGVDVSVDRRRALARVGAIFETPAFYDYLSGATNLRIFSEYTGPVERKRMDEVIEFVGLRERIGEPVKVYSHGMRQRLALAQALLPKPELLILDEPSEGLDPEGIHEIRNLILQLNRDWDLTILFSSHILSEVEQLCSHLAVMNQGRLVFAGEWRSADAGQRRVQIRVAGQATAEAGLVRDGLVASFEYDGHAHLAAGRGVADVAEWLVSHGHRIEALTPLERTLEDFYLEKIHGRGATH